jgi:4-hydroxybenzoate polyprenyltransferase
VVAPRGDPTAKLEQRVPDAPAGNWVDAYAPAALRPYFRLARLDRPIGSWLLLLPCWWSAALGAIAARDRPWLAHLALFALGAVAMRGAGSTYNDIVDRDLDAKVERTRARPLPSGQVSVAQALAFLALQGLVGLAVLVQFNAFTIALGFGSLVIVAAYPFMKRLMAMPQLVLGLAFAWGGLMGFVAHAGHLAAPAYLIYAAAIVWTIGYDTVYAMQDLEDDPMAGIKSSARFFGARARTAVGVFFATTVLLALMALVAAKAGPLAYGGLGLFTLHLVWQVRRIDASDPKGALMLFRSNRDAGLLLFAGLLLDALLGSR